MTATSARRREAPPLPAAPDALEFTADLVGQLVVPTFALDADRRVILWNAACERLTGMPAERVLGTRDHWRAFYDAERPCLADLLVEGRQDEIDANYPIHHRFPDTEPGAHTENWCVMPLRGTRLYLAIDAGPIRDADGRLVAVVETLRDMTVRQNAEEGIRLYANVFEHSGEAILVTDRENRIVSLNRSFTRLTGYTLDEVRGRNPSLLASGNTPPETYRAMWKAVRQQGFWQGELWDRCKDGKEYPRWAAISAIRDGAGELTHHIASFTDMTEHKAAADRIEYLAHHDALTGLCNRVCLEGRLAQSLLEARREGRALAVMFIDLDRFKVINDALGHHAGDLLLVEVARRLEACMRESDIVSRLGGDEFVVVCTRLPDAKDAGVVAAKLLHSLDDPYLIDGKALHSTPSIGVSVFPENGDDHQTLMKCADTAMYSAKAKGRNGFQFFTATMTAAATERLELERDLREALRLGQFELHYQPQVDAADGGVRGVEALVRWRHPQRGLVPPSRFIPVAEETGIIEPLGLWVLDEACRQLALWRDGGMDRLHMAVNLSAQQLRSPGLAEAVGGALRRHGLGRGDLELEVTESTAMADPERAIGQLMALRNLGVQLAIDDFGTGYSSLAYLKLLPIQILKLDRAFVQDIETDENDAAISAATLALAHSLGLRVVAEGIETEGQGAFLRRHGCDYLQGYLYGRPEPASVWTERWRRRDTRRGSAARKLAGRRARTDA